jgi:hypothetical protein
MYFLHKNFDNIEFPMAKLIHEEFNKLRNQYLKILKEQAAQTNINVKKFQRKQEQGQEGGGQPIAKLNKKQKREKDKMDRMMLKDKELQENILSVKSWIRIYCPQDYFRELLEVGNQNYLHDFSYLLLEQSNN